MSLANVGIDFAFTGRAAHAAAAPHLGRSALDAVELMNVGVNYMREHMPSDARIHYAMLDAGGIAPNVVQASAKVRYLVRAADLGELRPLVDRVRKIAEGAALMTETRVEATVVQRHGGTSSATGRWSGPCTTNAQRLGPPAFDAADRALAAAVPGDRARGRHRAPPSRPHGLPVEARPAPRRRAPAARRPRAAAASARPMSAT